MSNEELEKYYRDTFFPAVNLMLIGIQSKLRAPDIPEFSYCQGRVYSMRDLKDDWTKGVINIPREVLNEARLDESAAYEAVVSSPTIQQWTGETLARCNEDLNTLEAKLEPVPEWLTKKMCQGLIKPMRRVIGRYL